MLRAGVGGIAAGGQAVPGIGQTGCAGPGPSLRERRAAPVAGGGCCRIRLAGLAAGEGHLGGLGPADPWDRSATLAEPHLQGRHLALQGPWADRPLLRGRRPHAQHSAPLAKGRPGVNSQSQPGRQAPQNSRQDAQAVSSGDSPAAASECGRSSWPPSGADAQLSSLGAAKQPWRS